VFRSLGKSIRKPIIENLTINSVAASPNLQFSTYSQSYYNLLNMASIVDFNNLVGDFETFKVHSITLQVRRLVPETAMSSVYSTYIKPIYIAYYPSKVSYAPGSTAVIARESACVVDPMLIETQTASYKIPPISAVVSTGGVNYTYYMKAMLPTSAAAAIPGCLVLAMDNGTNASVSSALFAIRIIFDVEFSIPF